MRRLICLVAIGLLLGLGVITGMAATCGPLQINRSGANVVLSWSGSCLLQTTAQLENPAWTDLPGTSPVVVPATGSRRFFRTTDGSNYSSNVVGFVNLSLRSDPSGSGSLQAIISNPLNGTNNALNTILPLPDIYDGTTISRFDPATQSYGDPITFFSGVGWFSGGPLEDSIDPGEGFWIYPVGPNPLTVTFVGEVPQGTLVNPVPGPNQMSILSSIAPLTLPLGDAATPGTLRFPAADGDTVLIWNPVSQTYKDPYSYFDGIGWFSTNPDDPGPLGPTIPVATGFVVKKAGAAVNWTQIFNPAGNPCVPPTITVQPQPANRIVEACSCVTNTVRTTGDPPLAEEFNTGNGGFTVQTPLPYQGPWRYDAGSGSWREDGQEMENGQANTSFLNSPTVSVTKAGDVTLVFAHRYSFENGAWDGGQLRVSVNGGSFAAVTAFTQNGYGGNTVQASSTSQLAGQPAFTDESPGYGTGYITSIAVLGSFNVGDTIRVQFMAASDTNTRGTPPCWQIDRLVLNQGGQSYQWQRNGVNIPGANGTSYTKCPVGLADTGNYRVIVTNACGSVTSAAVNLTVLDRTAPMLRCPTNDIVVPGTSPTGAIVPYAVSATDCDPGVAIVCAPASGAIFPCGTTTVTCRATDSSGNASDCSFRVIVACDCMAVVHERIQAVPTVPGKFNYSFDYYNFSGVPVKYLFVVPKTGCLTASPDIITFKPPVPPGGVTNVSVMLTLGAGCSTGLCLTVSAHDTNLLNCCSTMRCLPNSLKPSPKITLAGTNIVFCWPEVFPDYVLECTTNLTPPSIWTQSSIPPTISNGKIYVTAPLTGQRKFFRLRQR